MDRMAESMSSTNAGSSTLRGTREQPRLLLLRLESVLWRQAPRLRLSLTSVRSLLPPVPLALELDLAEDATKDVLVVVAGAEAPVNELHRWLLVSKTPAVTEFVL